MRRRRACGLTSFASCNQSHLSNKSVATYVTSYYDFAVFGPLSLFLLTSACFWTLLLIPNVLILASSWTLIPIPNVELGLIYGLLNCLLIMEVFRNCVLCRRGLYRGRYQQHILADNLPRERPEFAAFIQQNAVLEVRTNYLILVLQLIF